MLSSLLLLAVAEPAHGHGEEAASGITKITHDFGVNLPSIAAQALSFAVVAFILWRFGFKPVLAVLDERQKKIDSGLKYAEEMKAKLAATQQESAQLIKTAQLEAQKLVDEARKAAKEFADRQQADAAARAADTLAKAQQAIELEHRKMLDQARGEIARLVVITTERVLAKKLSEADRTAYNEAAVQELALH
jgi:F-type H+-transporting ATPase subunit b